VSLTTDFLARFPSFTGDVATLMPIVEPMWASYYNKPYASNKEAVLNLVAHLMMVEIGGESLQTEQSKSVGSVSVSFQTSSRTGSMYDFLNTTRYGQRFLYLTSGQFGAVAV